MKCNICESRSLKFYTVKRGVQYFKCQNCHLIQQKPIPKIKDILKIYKKDDVDFKNAKSGSDFLQPVPEISSKEVLYYSILKTHLNGKNLNILDIGAGTGLTLALLRNEGYENLEGVEISSSACKMAKRLFNLNIRNLDISKAEFNNNSFDLIVLNHVIEHLRAPLVIFKKINHILRKNGLIFLSTPNVSCLTSIVTKSKWRYFIPNEHLFLFNKKSLNYLLNKIGFEIIEIKYLLYSKHNLIIWAFEFILPILIDIYRKIILRKDSLNNFFTSRDGIIIIARKIKNI